MKINKTNHAARSTIAALQETIVRIEKLQYIAWTDGAEREALAPVKELEETLRNVKKELERMVNKQTLTSM